jgi:BspA type Leucine rich repeat region (6 copies)/Hint domain
VYTYSGTTAYVSGYTRALSDSIIIPSSITITGSSHSVTSIGNSAFQASGLRSITIPSSVTSIDDYAFRDCSGLTSVTIPSSVTSIGDSAFSNCSGLTSVTIPSSVTLIKDYAFANCIKLTSVTIPSSVTSIGIGVFANCSGLTSVTIPSSVTSIGDGAFYRCSKLTSVTIPSSVTSIGNGAFNECNNLLDAYFDGTTLPTFGRDAFTGMRDFMTGKFNKCGTAYYKSGTNADSLTKRGWFTNYVVTDAPPPCFKEGSKILTSVGYKKVEDLRNGDLVKTLRSGYKEIYMIGKKEIKHEGVEERIKGQLYRCSRDSYPEVWEDLIITGCHSILVSDFKSEEERKRTIEVNGDAYVTERMYRLPACVDMRTKVYEKSGKYMIYHLALENEDKYMNYGIYANGLLVETCSKRYLKELSGMEEV